MSCVTLKVERATTPMTVSVGLICSVYVPDFNDDFNEDFNI